MRQSKNIDKNLIEFEKNLIHFFFPSDHCNKSDSFMDIPTAPMTDTGLRRGRSSMPKILILYPYSFQNSYAPSLL